jgi:predicted nucleic acid-binding protein
VTTVLDSWAVMSYLQDEAPAAMQVETLLQDERPVMSWINVGEIFYILRRRHGEPHARAAVHDLRGVVTVELPTTDRVIDAARVKSDHAMAYADAFAAATTIACGAVLWTGDPELLVEGSPWRWKDLRSMASTN